MKIPVLIERIAGNGYRARGGEPFGLQAQGRTREEALQRLRELIDRRLAQGANLVEFVIGDPPWAKFAGTWDKDDPLIKQWKREVKAYRREMDQDSSTR